MPTAIVTGCSREYGFGQRTAKTLAKAGFRVFATMRAAERGADLDFWSKASGVDLTVLEHDVTDSAQNRRVVDQVLNTKGQIDVLINNVGMSSFGALETLHEHHIRDVMETNFFSAVDMTRAVLPSMRERRSGRVLFVTSVAGVTGVPGESMYCASKFALEGLAEALAMETARFGIEISTIQPAFFNTGMSADNTDASGFSIRSTDWDEFNQRVVASTAEGETGGEDPQLVADTILVAATSPNTQLRWQPGTSAPAIIAARSEMTDEAWREYVMSELGMSDWLNPAAEVALA